MSTNKAIADAVLPGSNHLAIRNHLLKYQFFLPAATIEEAEADGWKIFPVRVIAHDLWDEARDILKGSEHVQYEPSEYVVDAARRVGVSVRITPAGKKLVVAKLWM